MSQKNRQENGRTNSKPVSSRKGVVWLILVLSLVVMLSISALIIREFFSGGDVTLGEFLMTLASIALFSWMLMTFSTLKVVVDTEGLRLSSVWGKRTLAWREVYSITVIPGYGYIPFIGYNVLLHTTTSRRGVPLATIMFGNSHRVMKAVIEAAYRGNPGISIKGSLLDTYGLPPYGIFKLEK